MTMAMERRRREDREKKTSEEERAASFRRFLILAIVVVAITGIAFITMFLGTVKRLQYVYTNQSYQDATILRKNEVSANISSFIKEIEQMRTLRLDDQQTLVNGLKPAVEQVLASASGDKEKIRAFFKETEGLSDLTCLVYNASTGKMLLDEAGLSGEAGVYTDDLAISFAVSAQAQAGGTAVLYGVTESAFEKDMQNILGERLASYVTDDDILYWVDRLTVLDDGTASEARVLDPKNPQRAGMKLGMGGTGSGPDQFATEGLLAAGGEQIFHTGEAGWTLAGGETVQSATLTCAEYYEPYSWAVCGAIRLDSIGLASVASQEASRKETIRLGAMLAIGFVVMLAIAIFVILRGNTRYFNVRQKRLREKVEKDALTGANTRGYGQTLLETAFHRFQDGTEASPILMVLDVDKFKSINDTYGHDGGDEALKRIVKSATRVMRGRDCVIRWGGDEFIAVFYKMEHARSEQVANRLRKAIADTEVKHGSQSFQVTVSVGVTWFRFGDTDYNNALKRADTALYKSKEEGRNRVCVAGIEE